jgi:hypothetical protein
LIDERDDSILAELDVIIAFPFVLEGNKIFDFFVAIGGAIPFIALALKRRLFRLLDFVLASLGLRLLLVRCFLLFFDRLFLYLIILSRS